MSTDYVRMIVALSTIFMVGIIVKLYVSSCESEYNKKQVYPIDISSQLQDKMLHDSSPPNQLYTKKQIYKKPSLDNEVNVSWDLKELSDRILAEIPSSLYGWYHESTSSNGTSCQNAIESFTKTLFNARYLNPNKEFSLKRELVLSSKAFGKSVFRVDCPFFTVPYGMASEYGGISDDLSTSRGTVKAGGIYTIPTITKYSLSTHVETIRKTSMSPTPFFMFQLYVTTDDDINLSIIEHVKELGVAIIILTIDTGTNNHGGIPLLELQSDLTYARVFCSHLFCDPVFTIKCYQQLQCVGTTDINVLRLVSSYLNVSIDTLAASFNAQKSFDYAKTIFKFGNLNVEQNGVKSIRHIADMCHLSRSTSPYVKRSISKGVAIVVKGCLTVKDALDIQEAGADGVYVTNHGGRFIFNAPAPLDVLTEIRESVKRNSPDFGVWMDGGIRHGADILAAYAKGAEFVGVGRPIIYACVLYGEDGVSSITKKLLFELSAQAISCGVNNLQDWKSLKHIIK